MDNDEAYYALRAAVERSRGQAASDAETAAAHETLACTYDALAKALAEANGAEFGTDDRSKPYHPDWKFGGPERERDLTSS